MTGLKNVQKKKTQATLIKDVEEIKTSLHASEKTEEITLELAKKADITELEALKHKIEDLENCLKCNNIVIWGIEEHSETEFNLVEHFFATAIF